MLGISIRCSFGLVREWETAGIWMRVRQNEESADSGKWVYPTERGSRTSPVLTGARYPQRFTRLLFQTHLSFGIAHSYMATAVYLWFYFSISFLSLCFTMFRVLSARITFLSVFFYLIFFSLWRSLFFLIVGERFDTVEEVRVVPAWNRSGGLCRGYRRRDKDREA